jgi:hypothetical protein
MLGMLLAAIDDTGRAMTGGQVRDEVLTIQPRGGVPVLLSAR